jgi:enoyl-CoA hydratase/carnithine racemase
MGGSKMEPMSSSAQSSATGTNTLLRSDRNGIALLTLNRPQARNSLSEAMIAELNAALVSIREEASVRAVVIAASGPVFSAGHDLKELTARRSDPDKGRAYFRNIFSQCAVMMQAIVELPQPVIAAVEGVATAAGCQLAASCDLIVASENARFALPGVNIGFYCSVPMVALTRKIAPAHAFEILLTGDPIGAKRAYEIGLVNRIAGAGRALDTALELAAVIASKSSHVQKLGKAAFYKQHGMNLGDAYKFTLDVAVDNMFARDAEEGISAFVEKRTPKWEDR